MKKEKATPKFLHFENYILPYIWFDPGQSTKEEWSFLRPFWVFLLSLYLQQVLNLAIALPHWHL